MVNRSGRDMTVDAWTDHHHWRVNDAAMEDARAGLSDSAFTAMVEDAAWDGGDYILPREAIEDAALAMADEAAIQFLGNAYHLGPALAARLLRAIRIVRKRATGEP